MSNVPDPSRLTQPTEQYATEHPLPSDKFYAIEFPGRIRPQQDSIDRAVQHLGGPSAIARAFKRNASKLDSLLEINWRPGNSFSHPIPSRTVVVNNLLMKVVKRKRIKRDGKMLETPEWEFTAKIVGVVPKTIRFRNMADFQYEPDPEDPVVQLRSAMDRMDVERILNYEIPKPTDEMTDYQTHLRTFPPPLFSRLAIPHIYNFKANPMSVVTTFVDSQTGEEKKRLINRQRWKGYGPSAASMADEKLPKEPSQTVKDAEEKRDERLLGILRELFATRPVWLKAALLNQLSAADARTVVNSKHLLPLVSYTFIDGPWRDTLIRFSYDPRKTIEAHIYQRIYFRNVNHPLPRASIIGRGQQDDDSPGRTGTNSPSLPQPDAPDEIPPSHIFDGRHLSKDTASFQLCDITDPMLNAMIMDKNGLRDHCDERDGWYTLQHFEQIKTLIRAKFFSLLDGHVLTEEECKDVLEGNIATEKQRKFFPRKHNMAKGALPPEEAAARRLRAALDGSARQSSWGRNAR